MARDEYLRFPVRHDYTMAELHRLSCIAVRSAGTRAADWRDRYDTAWSAITEELFCVWEAPSERDLVHVGRAAVLDDFRAYLRHHGQTAEGIRPAFLKYWWDMTWSVPSHENHVIDRLGLAQILWSLAPDRREALIALAIWNDHSLAAMALGITYRAFTIRLNKARADFRSLWHEGEEPSQLWHPSQRMRWRMDKRKERDVESQADP